MNYAATELVLNDEGQVYHLGLSPENVSDKIIVVGDQKRVELVASLFDTIEHQSQHREFACATGVYQGKRITALSTGIGTDNIDIVMNELDAIANIDIPNRCDKKNFTQLSIIRIGTCGILDANTPVHSYIVSTHALGLDNIGHFYHIPFSEEEKTLNSRFNEKIKLPENIISYLCEASPKIVEMLLSDKTHSGITITSSGFYGPQGRQLRLKGKSADLNEQLTALNDPALPVVNFEMESSALFAMGKALNHNCGTICLGIANRPNMEFSDGYKKHMKGLVEYVLDRI